MSMKEAAVFLFVLLAIVLVLAMIGLASEYIWHSTFIEELVATLAGVVVGVPIALWINRQNLEAEEKVKRANEKQEAAIRKSQVLKRVKSELQYNLQALEEQEKALNSDVSSGGIQPRTIIEHRLKAELWDSLRYSGDLQWINDLKLLDQIVTAYHQIRTITLIEESYLPESFLPAAVSGARDAIAGAVKGHVRNTIPNARKDVTQALAALDTALSKAA